MVRTQGPRAQEPRAQGPRAQGPRAQGPWAQGPRPQGARTRAKREVARTTARLYSTLPPLLHEAAFTQRGSLYSTRQPLPHEAAFTQQSYRYSTRQPLPNEAGHLHTHPTQGFLKAQVSTRHAAFVRVNFFTPTNNNNVWNGPFQTSLGPNKMYNGPFQRVDPLLSSNSRKVDPSLVNQLYLLCWCLSVSVNRLYRFF